MTLFRTILVLVLLTGAAAFGQTLTGQLKNPQTLQVKTQIDAEGSYQLQRASMPFTNWVVLTNFNALRGSLTWDEPISISNRFFRAARLTNPPAFTTQPVGMTNYSGQTVRLEAAVTGSWPLRMQWYKSAQLVSGAVSNVLSFTGTSALSGDYNLLVSNSWGQVISTPVTVLVIPPASTNLFGRRVHFDIVAGTGNFYPSGSFDTYFDPAGFHNTTSTNAYLNDIGEWSYGRLSETTAQLYYSHSITYPQALFNLTFQTTTNGTYSLTAPGFSGGQTGKFRFTN